MHDNAHIFLNTIRIKIIIILHYKITKSYLNLQLKIGGIDGLISEVGGGIILH